MGRGLADIMELVPTFLGVVTVVFIQETILLSRSCQCILSEMAL